MIRQSAFTALLSIGVALCAEYAAPAGFNMPIYGESPFQVFEPEKEACAETSVYFFLDDLVPEKAYTYAQIRKKFQDLLGERPYSFLDIESFLLKEGIDVKIVRLDNPDDIYALKKNNGILYFPPSKDSKLGHFSYIVRDSDGIWVLVDPSFSLSKKLPINKELLKTVNWQGIILIRM